MPQAFLVEHLFDIKVDLAMARARVFVCVFVCVFKRLFETHRPYLCCVCVSVRARVCVCACVFFFSPFRKAEHENVQVLVFNTCLNPFTPYDVCLRISSITDTSW